MNNNIELLAPAGEWDALVAAVESGADAVYLGMKTLNARRGAGNFDDELLMRASDYCHERGKRMYVTVNTMVKADEMGLVEQAAESLARVGADAAIVQDFGVARALQSMLPSLRLHASTQMAAHNRQAAEFLKNSGFERVVLAREMSFEEISRCAETGVELEVFCHGALCVSTSGQCLFSSMVGGRSGNRGMCAQPCRLRYSLTGAGQKTEGCLLSPKDIMTVEILGEMRRAGVKSLKIEGRLKRPEYVHVVTSVYRRALDGAVITENDIEALKQIFNRGGFTRGYAAGIQDGGFLSRVRPSHGGIQVGASADGRKIRLLKDVEGADALMLRAANGAEYPVAVSGCAGETVKNPVGVSGDLMRLVSVKQMEAARAFINETHRMTPISIKVDVRAGENARAEITDGENTAAREGWLVERANRPADNAERIRSQFEKLGGTPYFVRDIAINCDADAFVPASAANALRRDAVQALKEMRIQKYRGCAERAEGLRAKTIPRADGKTRLVAAVRDASLLRIALEAGADEAAFMPMDIRVGALEAQVQDARSFFLALPPVTPRASLDELNRWANENADRLKGVYLSNVGHLGLRWPGEIRFDYALNIANNEALRFLKAEDCVYTPSVELTNKEIAALGGRRELIVYGRLPLMHLRHCPLNAAMGGGKHEDCHRCDRKKPFERLEDCALIDRMNVSFPLCRMATEEGCVIDVLNSVPLSLIKHADRLTTADGWRLLFIKESPEDVRRITRAYRDALEGKEMEGRMDGSFTTGHYFRPVE